MKFTKRNLGDNVSRTLFGLLGIGMLIAMITYPDMVLIICGIPIVLLAIVRSLGKEMVEIDPVKSTMDTYYQVVFEFFRSRHVLSNISDFHPFGKPDKQKRIQFPGSFSI